MNLAAVDLLWAAGALGVAWTDTTLHHGLPIQDFTSLDARFSVQPGGMDADRPQSIRRHHRRILFQNHQVCRFADFETAAGLIQMTLPGCVDGHRADCLRGRYAFVQI